MAVGAILASALTTHAARDRALWVGGVDVMKDPAGRYGAPVEDIELFEAGSYGVSTLSFTVNDPQLLLAFQPGMEVRFWDLTWDVPLFVGWVDPYAALPAFGTGRKWSIQCVGVEALLDWSVLTSDVTLSLALLQVDQFIALLSASTCPIGLNVGCAFDTVTPSTRAEPISSYFMYGGTDTYTVPAGTTLREAFRTVLQHSVYTLGSLGTPVFAFTIDWWFGLRVYHTNEIVGWSDDPDDARPLSVVDTPPAGPFRASGLDYTTEGIVPRSVYVQGGNAAGSGLVSDGSGIVGPTATMRDATILSATARDAAGLNYLLARQSGLRGSFTLENVTFSSLSSSLTQTRPDSILAITDTQAGLDGGSTLRLVSGIRKRFHGTLEDWTITFGGPPPSLSNLMRSLTRDTRS